MMEDNDSRTLFTGNLSPEVTEDLLYELFLQAGPLEKVCIPKNPKGAGGHRSFGFVTFRHAVSARYATDLMQGVALFGRQLAVRSRTQNSDQSDGRSAVKLTPRRQNSEPGTSGMYQHQNNGPNMLHVSRMTTMQGSSMTSVMRSPAATELIVLDSDSSPSSFRSPQKNRDYNSTLQRGPYRSFSDGPAFMTPPRGNIFGPPSSVSPIRNDGQQQRFWTQPSPNAGMASVLQDPWKHFDQFRNAAQENDRRYQHPHHQRHHQSWSPYGGNNQQRRS